MFNIRGAATNRREAFCAAVMKFQSPEWSPAFPDTDTFEVDGRYRTIREDFTVGMLMGAMRGDRRLLELLGPSRTYATASQCLLALLDNRVTAFRTRR
jgi:hypothetical protein